MRLIGYLNDKGGSGKSFACSAHADILRRAGKQPLLVDTDGEVGHLARMFGERDATGKLLADQSRAGVRRYGFHADERDRIEFASILEERADLVLVDFPAASVMLLNQVERDYGFFRLAHQRGYDVTLVVVITPDAASMASLRGAAVLDPAADLVLVRNAAFGDSTDFIVWDGSAKENIKPAGGKALLAGRGGNDLTLPMLNRGTVALIGAKKMSFTGASAEDSPLSLGRRSQVATWLDAVERAYREAGDVMGLEPLKVRSARVELAEVEA
jgi:hypothetical protein